MVVAIKSPYSCSYTSSIVSNFSLLTADIASISAQRGSDNILLAEYDWGTDDMIAGVYNGTSGNWLSFSPQETQIYATATADTLFTSSGWAGRSPSAVVSYTDAATNLVQDYFQYNLTGNTWISNATAYDIAGNANSTETRNVTIDASYPQYSARVADPSSPATYASNTLYQFNSTWTDNNAIGTVKIEFNNVNYSVTKIGDVYNFSIRDLAAGTYNYYWFANDTFGNTNITSVQTYTINKASSSVNTFLNNSRSNIIIPQNTAIYLNGTKTAGEGIIQIYNNGTIINSGLSPLSNLTNFTQAGIFNITTLYPATQNYTLSSENFTINVTSAGASIAVLLSDNLSSGIFWNLQTLPAINQSANGNNGSGETFYFINVSVQGGTADMYLKANGNLMNAAGDVIGLGNETYSLNQTNSSVPGSSKFAITTNYADNKIGSDLGDGSAIYLKFFLNAPQAQSAGTYNNSVSFKIVQSGESP